MLSRVANELRLLANSIGVHTLTGSRLLRLVVAISKEEEARLEKSFRNQYQKYLKRHPDSDMSESDYVKQLWDQHNKATARNDVAEGDKEDAKSQKKQEVQNRKDKAKGDQARKDIQKDRAQRDDASSEDAKPDGEADKPVTVTDKDDQESLEDHGIDKDVDQDKLKDTLKELLGDGKEPTDIAGALESVADKLVNVVDIDDYVMNMPDEAKQLAEHLKQRKEKSDESANKALSTGASYKEYADAAKVTGTPAVTEAQYNKLLSKAQEASEKSLTKELEKGEPDDTYQDYVKRKKEEGEVPVTKETWNAIIEGKKGS